MHQLSGLDASFLYLETPEMPMHVGALHVFELPAGYNGRFVRDLRKHIASRLPVAPVLRRRLWWMPLNLANPAWVDVEPDLAEHIVEIRLPKRARHGDGMAELQAQVASLHPVLLDRRRALWKFHVFEGLAPAGNGCKRVALYSQLHHAAVDGQAAVALAQAIFDLSPQPRTVEAGGGRRSRTVRLGAVEMLRGALANQITQVSAIVKELPSTVGTLTGAARTVLGRSALLGSSGAVRNLTLAPKTPFNVSITPRRAFAAVTLSLPEMKALARAHDATLNDAVLFVCSTALRRHLARQRVLPKKSLIAAVPVSLRDGGATRAGDNQVSMSLISLGTHLADPAQRLAHIRAASAAMKATLGSVKSVLPTDFPSLGMPWLIEAAAALVGKARIADRVPQVANVVISNVPGPPVPLYLAGAKMLTNYPTSIVTHGMALNITVQSYDRSLDFGLMADAQAMPDVQDFARAIEVGFDDLRALPLPHEAAAAVGPGVVDRATRAVRGAIDSTIGGAVRGAVGGVVGGAMKAAVGDAMKSTLRSAVRTAVDAATGARTPARAVPAAQPVTRAARPATRTPAARRPAARDRKPRRG